MANNFNITIDSAYPTAPAVQVADSDSGAWVTHNLQVKISLEKPTAQSTTHYKVWGTANAATEGAASWVAWPGGSQATVTGTLADVATKQTLYAKFKNDGVEESSVVTASGVYFSWTDPSISNTVQWKDAFSTVDYDAASFATLQNTVDNIEIELNKSNIPGLSFDSVDLSGLSVSGDRIIVEDSSAFAELINGAEVNKVSVQKVFDADEQPMIAVDTGSGLTTITAYDGSIKTTQSGTHGSRVENINYNSNTKTLTFDIKEFSTYGFTTINKVEFSSTTGGGYNGNAIQIEVTVRDTNNETVESAPVTITKVSGDTIGSFASNPVNTDSNGVATFTLNLNSNGTCVFDAYVDDKHTADDLTAWCIATPASLQRSLLTQYEQIRNSATYSDTVSGVNNQAVAEPSGSTYDAGSDDVLEHDMNVFRTLLQQIKGTTNWYDELGTYFDPTATSSGKELTLDNIAGNTLDSKTIILAVTEDQSGSGWSTSSGTEGILWTTTLLYADSENRRGLPIFKSVTNSGTYYDEGGSDDVCRIDLINSSTGAEFEDASGNEIYAKFHDAADHGGTGEYTDVYVKFYTDLGEYTFTGDDPTNISFVYPFRKVLSEMEEHEWQRTDFVSSWEGDAELVEDVSNMWSFTGAGDDITGPSFNNTGNNYMLSPSDSSLTEAINSINDEFGDFTYTEQNYVTDNESTTASLDALDIGVKDVNDLVTAGSGDKYVEELSGDLSAGTLHSLPAGVTYTPDATIGQEGKNMEVFINGQLLAASTGANGVNADRDYAETTASGITFHLDLWTGTNITYVVRQ